MRPSRSLIHQIEHALSLGVSRQMIRSRLGASVRTINSVAAGRHPYQLAPPLKRAPKPLGPGQCKPDYLPSLHQIWEVETPAIQAAWDDDERYRRMHWRINNGRRLIEAAADSDVGGGWTAPECSTELVA
jgi:hypothetical protein